MSSAVWQWLDETVIGLELCPFARRVRERAAIRLVRCAATAPTTLLEKLAAEMIGLVASECDDETTLFVATEGLRSFDDYLEVLAMANTLLVSLGLEGELQIASFHPQYRFADVDADDPANLTNRAPYPIFHLLQEASVERAIASHPDPESIPDRNVQRLRERHQDASSAD